MKSGLLRDHHDLIQATQRIFDLVLIVGVHVLMTLVYGQWWRQEYSSATVVAVLVFSVAAELCSLYRPWRIERIQVEVRTVMVAWMSTIAILITVAFATKMSEEYSRVVSFGWFGLVPVAMCGWRLCCGRSFASCARTAATSRAWRCWVPRPAPERCASKSPTGPGLEFGCRVCTTIAAPSGGRT